MSLGWEEDGMIEQEMIELCGSSDINDLILYCRSLKQDCVRHITEVKRLREGIKSYLDLEIETHELKEMIE